MGKHNEIEYQAQADNLPVDNAVRLLSDSIDTLKDVRFVIGYQKPTKDRRAELRRQLSGVLAKVEIVRKAIRD